MGLEALMEGPNGSKIRTNPVRDVAHFWPDLIAYANEGLRKANWEPWYAEYLAFHGVGEEQLLIALACYSDLLTHVLDTDVKIPFDAGKVSGFFACPMAAQVVVMAKMGQLATGAFWAGAKSAVPEGDVPASYRALHQFATEFQVGHTRALNHLKAGKVVPR